MSLTVFIIIIIFLAMIVSSVLLLKQSAKKFNLTDQQKESIKKRNLERDKEDDSY